MRSLALLGLAAGDVLGAAVEGLDRDTVARRLDGLPPPGTAWTDDTQQALLIARHLLEHREVDGVALAVDLRARGLPHRGIGPGFARFLDTGMPQPSAGNGAAMRSAPIGVRFGPERVVGEAMAAAMVTHADPRGVASAVAVAAAVAHAPDGVAGADLLAEVAEDVTDAEHRLFADHGLRFGPGDRWHTFSEALRAAIADVGEAPAVVADRVGDRAASTSAARETGGTHPYAPASVVTALVLAAAATDPVDAVRAAVALGGDTDTVAAITGAVVGARFGVRSWPWAVPRADLLVEIGNRLVHGGGVDGLPDPAEMIA